MKRTIAREDILDLDAYAPQRRDIRRRMSETKKIRRLHIGPHAVAHFECYDTMWYQVQEMLYIEKGGDEQLVGELAAYNPLIPQGHELVATVMLQIEDEGRRRRFLATVGGIEETMALDFAGERVKGVPEADLDRTSEDGKASSVQFVHFPFTAEQIAKFKAPGTQVAFAIEHPNYTHAALMPEPVRAALAEDLE
jgi:hypothetical protein